MAKIFILYKRFGGISDASIYIDNSPADFKGDYLLKYPNTMFICIERALELTKKFFLKNQMQDKFFAF